MNKQRLDLALAIVPIALKLCSAAAVLGQSGQIGRELAVPHHLRDGDEFKLSAADLVEFGRKLFTANWTDQDGRLNGLGAAGSLALSWMNPMRHGAAD